MQWGPTTTYLKGIRQQFHGVGHGDTTDDGMSGSEQAESEPLESDPHVSTSNSKDRPIGAEIILNDLTAQLNNVLAREHRSYASILQHLRWICWALPIRMAAMRTQTAVKGS